MVSHAQQHQWLVGWLLTIKGKWFDRMLIRVASRLLIWIFWCFKRMRSLHSPSINQVIPKFSLQVEPHTVTSKLAIILSSCCCWIPTKLGDDDELSLVPPYVYLRHHRHLVCARTTLNYYYTYSLSFFYRRERESSFFSLHRVRTCVRLMLGSTFLS